jgi:hypothetical protein
MYSLNPKTEPCPQAGTELVAIRLALRRSVRRIVMNDNSGLALIVGALVVVVAVFFFFGTNVFRGGGDGDVDVKIEAPAEPNG